MTTFVLITGLILLAMLIGLLFNPKPWRPDNMTNHNGISHGRATYDK